MNNPEFHLLESRWMGTIPRDWRVSAVKHYFKIQLGKMLQNYPSSDQDILVSYLKANNVLWGKVNLDVSEMWASPYEIEQYEVIDGDLLVCEGGEGGRAGILKSPPDPCIIQNALHRVRPKLSGSIEYLRYVLQAVSTSGWFDVLCNKATISHFTREKFCDLRIPLPTIVHQNAIVTFLDRKTERIDKLITLKEKQIEILQEKRSTLISHAVTKGLNPDVKMKDSGVEWVGQIPEYWKISRIKFTTYVKGRVGWHGLRSDEFCDKGPYLVTGTDFINGKIDWSNCYHIDIERYKEDPYIHLKEGDLLITKDGTIGKIALVRSLPNIASVNSGIFVTRPLNNQYLNSFMFWLLQSSIFYRYIQYSTNGSTIQHLFQETFDNFAYALPPLEEQQQIIDYLQRETLNLDNLIDSIHKSIDLLREYRTGLISATVTGKIDVREECNNG